MKVSCAAAVVLILMIGSFACSSPNEEHARQQASQDVHNAGKELKKEAKELRQRVDAAVQPDQESASDKMSHAEAEIKSDASRAGVRMDHAALLAKVKASLVSDAGLSTITNVNVQVEGTEVTLTGKVASEDQKRAVERAASQVSGVTRVQNRLTVQ